MSAKFLAAWILSLTAAGAVLAAAGWSNPFVLDAVNKIQDNPDVRSHQLQWSTLFDAYSGEHAKGSHLRNDPSRPLTYFCYWWLWKAGDGQPWPFHLFSMMLHAASSFLVGWLALRRLSRPATGVLASFLFLVMPVNVGTVLYPFALSDVLAAFFTLLILAIRQHWWSWKTNALAGFCMVLALASKQSAVVIPAAVLAFFPKCRRLTSLLAAIAGVYLLIRFWRFGGVGDLEAESTYPAGEYFLNQGVMIWKYIALLLWPSGQSLDHWVKLTDYSTVLKIVAWLSIGLVTWRSLGNKQLRAFWLLFLIPLLPTSSVFPTTDLFVERRAYLSSAGIILLLLTAARRWRPAIPAVALACLIYFGLSVRRAAAFHEPEYVYREALKLYPDDARSLGNLASLQLRKHEYAEAHATLQKTLKLNPSNLEAISNLAALHQLPDSGFFNPEQAEMLYVAALQLDANHAPSMRNLGFLKLSLKRGSEAKALFSRVLQLAPRDALALTGMGKAEQMDGHLQQARQYFEAALREEPGLAIARESLRSLQ